MKPHSDDSNSSPVQANKRRKTTTDFTRSPPPQSLPKSERQKTAKTPGRADRLLSRNIFTDDSANFELLKEVAEAFTASVERSKAREGSTIRNDEQAVLPAPAPWDLPPTLREDFEQHEPLLFPNVSSTVPDSTLDRERMVEAAALGDREVSAFQFQISLKPPEPSSSSTIPWSEYFATPHPPSDPLYKSKPINSPLRYLLSTAEQQPEPAQRAPPMTPHTPPGSPRQPDTRDHTAIGAISPASTTQSRRQTPANVDLGNADELLLLEGQTLGVTTDLTISTISDEVRAPNSSSERRQKAKVDDLVSQPQSNGPNLARLSDIELPIATDPSGRIPAVDKNPLLKATKTKRRVVDDFAEDDELALGLPKEMYKPRPSRSRSAQVKYNAVDMSQFPEQRRRNKRRKTTDPSMTPSNMAATISPNAEKVGSVAEMGFSPTLAKKALRKSFGDVGEAVDLLVNGNVSPSKKPKARIDEEGVEHADDPAAEARNNGQKRSRHVSHVQVTPLEPQAMSTTPPEQPIQEDKAPTTVDDGDYVHPATSDVEKKKTKRKTTPRRPTIEPLVFGDPAVEPEPPVAPPQNNDTTEIEPLPDAPTTQRKKSQGRARTNAKAVQEQGRELVTLDNVEHGVIPEEVAPHHSKRSHDVHNSTSTREPLQNVAGNSIVVSASDTHLESAENGEPTEQSLQSKRPTSTPESCEKSVESFVGQSAAKAPTSALATKSTTGQSPGVPKGKVPYRVGLSRRARIAPLLRVVKK
jgi:UBA/TS-N domain